MLNPTGFFDTPSLSILILLCLSFGSLVLSVSSVPSSSAGEEIDLTILHTNDVHSRFLQTNTYSGSCSDEDARDNKCYGGFARLHYKVREIRASHKNVLYLSGGDYFQGTVWYTLYKWNVVSRFVNVLNHTAMALGNHEFDDNIAGLVPFLEASTFPIISSNIDDSKEPSIQGKYKKSVIVQIEGGIKVGIIGFTTIETSDISVPGELIFLDPVSSINEEAQRLHNEEGVKILIAVGHAGYDVDMKIAKEVPLIDLVVGGHTNTFLYHGEPPDVEKAKGDYPTIIKQEGGKEVPVVQAYAFGKYLGYLNLKVNQEGEVTSWNGNPILLDGSVPQDPALLEEIQEWGKNVSSLTRLQIGKTRVFLDGSAETCRLKECNLGNLVADAMVYNSLKYSDELYWSDITMAIVNGGGLRSSIDEKARNGSITMDDILTVLPFQNTIDLIEIKGSDLLKAFEFGVQGYDPSGNHLAGKFLQVSGIRVVYDITKKDGSKVKRISVLCKACKVPDYVPLNYTEVYKIAVPTYLATGGDGFGIIKRTALSHRLSGILDTDMLIEYIQSQGPIIQGIEGRIQFEDDQSTKNCNISFAPQNKQNYFILIGIVTFQILRILN